MSGTKEHIRHYRALWLSLEESVIPNMNNPIYIESSKRYFQLLQAEHQNDKTALAKHCKKCKCEPLWEKTKINSFHQTVELI